MDPAPGSVDDTSLEWRLQVVFEELEELRRKVAELEEQSSQEQG